MRTIRCLPETATHGDLPAAFACAGATERTRVLGVPPIYRYNYGSWDLAADPAAVQNRLAISLQQCNAETSLGWCLAGCSRILDAGIVALYYQGGGEFKCSTHLSSLAELERPRYEYALNLLGCDQYKTRRAGAKQPRIKRRNK